MRTPALLLALTSAALMATACPALAAPTVHVDYRTGVPQIELEGSYPHSTYTVLRADRPDGIFSPITAANVLCMGACFGVDTQASPGSQYAYRFDLTHPDGRFESFGPYAVTISPLLARVVGVSLTPNPGRGPAQLHLFMAGTAADPAVPAETALYDLQGRKLRVLQQGTLSRGITSIEWDGRDGAGHSLVAGVYFVRIESARGSASARFLRLR